MQYEELKNKAEDSANKNYPKDWKEFDKTIDIPEVEVQVLQLL
ncbi:MAG: hypothetical protein ACXWFC_11055 [Nitrososphaeraceae archaeon]